MDLHRLVVSHALGGNDGACRTPHLWADVMALMHREGYAVRVTSALFVPLNIKFTVNGNTLHCYESTEDAASTGVWFYVSRGNKFVRFNPVRTCSHVAHTFVAVGAENYGAEYDALSACYAAWNGSVLDLANYQVKEYKTAAYVDATVFFEAIKLLITFGDEEA